MNVVVSASDRIIRGQSSMVMVRLRPPRGNDMSVSIVAIREEGGCPNTYSGRKKRIEGAERQDQIILPLMALVTAAVFE